MALLAGGLAAGDRVSMGGFGLTGQITLYGTVLGAATRPALKPVAVLVRWDDGRETDERISSLRVASRAASGTSHSRRPASASASLRQDSGSLSPRQGNAAYTLPSRPISADGRCDWPRMPSRSGGCTPTPITLGLGGALLLKGAAVPPLLAPSVGPPSSRSPSPAVAREDLRPPRTHMATPTYRRQRSEVETGEGPLEMLRRHSMKLGAEDLSRGTQPRSPRTRLNSQFGFADRSQTVIVFDWDDTLFPTSYLLDVLKLDWKLPLAHQRGISLDTQNKVASALAKCELHAVGILEQAYSSGHVVVVTLAAKGWVEQACRMYYPKVGEALRMMGIRIINAQEKQKGDSDARSRCGSDEEYYGLLKGRAIAAEVDKFYTQYEGQTWKNVLSIGDSRFERYGLLAASAAYMQCRRLSDLNDIPVSPSQQGAWQKVEEGDHLIRLRVKSCKLVDSPDIQELTIELDLVAKWLHLMVALDSGFDLDIEALVDPSLVSLVEAVLRGERPSDEMPGPVKGVQ